MSLKENIDTLIHDQLLFSSMISYCGYTILQGVSEREREKERWQWLTIYVS